MTDYIIVISLLLAFFIKQVESYYNEKLINANDSYTEAKTKEKINKYNFLFRSLIFIAILAIIYWAYKL